MRSLGAVTIAAFAVLLLAPAATAGTEGPERLTRADATAIVGYRSEAALKAALATYPGTILRRLPVLGAAEVRPHIPLARFAASMRRLPGIVYVQRPRPRAEAAEPALLTAPSRATPYQWQWYATRTHLVPEAALRGAANVTIAVIDTGADVSAPDLAAKAPQGFDLDTGSTSIEDAHGHGTFVASLAAGSVTNGEGIAGSGGDARLLVIRAGGKGRFTDLDEARAIVAAVERGAKIINLSFGGTRTSATEQRAIDFAASRGVLLVAAVGNEFSRGNPVEYPAALLQPEGSSGKDGVGLAVAASTTAGRWASFSNTGSWVSLAAPGEAVFGAVSSLSSPNAYPRVALSGSSAGLYGFGTGTSYAAPQVAGAAALVWGANPSLSAADVARILKETAQGGGRWTPELGYGVVDVAAAVARATGQPAAAPATEIRTVPLSLSASKTRVRAAARLALTATLAPGKEIVLEILGPGGWQEQSRAVADPDGKVKWQLSLAPGKHRLRARHETLTSRPLAIVVSR